MRASTVVRRTPGCSYPRTSSPCPEAPPEVSENPDLLVGFAVTTEDKTDVQQIYTDQSLGYVMGQTSVREYQEGTLILFFADPKEKQVIWQGSGTETFQNPSQQTVNERIGVAVKNILKDFPPKK
jgi:hypothetical protein